MSILSTSPTSTRHFDMNIAAALGDINAAIIIQQLHYWMSKKEVGVIADGIKYVYNTFYDWTSQQFSWLSVWQFRKSMSLLRSLSIVKVIRYKASQWNQTNHYSLDYERLQEWAKAESIEISEMWATTPQDVNNQHLEVRDSEISLYKSKNTNLDLTAKQVVSDRPKIQSPPSAAAPREIALKEEEIQKGIKPPTERRTACTSQKNSKLEQAQSNIDEDKTSGKVDYIVNKDWSKQIEELDSAGVPINKTVVNLLKMYTPEQIRRAIALFKARKRDQHIPNPSGYFVAALKGDWGSKQIVTNESTGEIDTAAVFRHWYDLARELGYCSSQEVRDGEQWVCISGSWEKWADAVERGYSLEYLKKIMKRNTRQ
jgi:hypothetical protein